MFCSAHKLRPNMRNMRFFAVAPFCFLLACTSSMRPAGSAATDLSTPALVDAGMMDSGAEEPLQVAITSPGSSPYFANGPVAVAVIVSGGAADGVLLLANGSPLAML